jgi:hypothetical protein
VSWAAERVVCMEMVNVVVSQQRRHPPDTSAIREWRGWKSGLKRANRERGTKVRFDRDDVPSTKLRTGPLVPNFDFELGVPFARRVMY